MVVNTVSGSNSDFSLLYDSIKDCLLEITSTLGYSISIFPGASGELATNVSNCFESNLKSKKDLEDARHLRIVYEELINENEIHNIKKMIKELRL